VTLPALLDVIVGPEIVLPPVIESAACDSAVSR
jgi:hypothetical protein